MLHQCARRCVGLVAVQRRFGNHGGDSGGRCDEAIAHTTVYLPEPGAAGDLPQGVEQVGEIEANELRRTYRYYQNHEKWEAVKLPV